MSINTPNIDNAAFGRRAMSTWANEGVRGVVSGEVIELRETGVATTTGKIFVPKRSVLMDIGIQAQVLWDDGTSAVMVIGLYDNAGSVIDANGYLEAGNLKATDLTANQSIRVFGGTDFMGGEAGALVQGGTNTHWDRAYLPDGGEIRFVVTAGGADGSAGRTICWANWFAAEKVKSYPAS